MEEALEEAQLLEAQLSEARRQLRAHSAAAAAERGKRPPSRLSLVADARIDLSSLQIDPSFEQATQAVPPPSEKFEGTDMADGAGEADGADVADELGLEAGVLAGAMEVAVAEAEADMTEAEMAGLVKGVLLWPLKLVGETAAAKAAANVASAVAVAAATEAAVKAAAKAAAAGEGAPDMAEGQVESQAAGEERDAGAEEAKEAEEAEEAEESEESEESEEEAEQVAQHAQCAERRAASRMLRESIAAAEPEGLQAFIDAARGTLAHAITPAMVRRAEEALQGLAAAAARREVQLRGAAWRANQRHRASLHAAREGAREAARKAARERERGIPDWVKARRCRRAICESSSSSAAASSTATATCQRWSVSGGGSAAEAATVVTEAVRVAAATAAAVRVAAARVAAGRAAAASDSAMLEAVQALEVAGDWRGGWGADVTPREIEHGPAFAPWLGSEWSLRNAKAKPRLDAFGEARTLRLRPLPEEVLRLRQAAMQPYLDLWDEEAAAQLFACYDVFASRRAMGNDLAPLRPPPARQVPLNTNATPPREHSPVEQTQALLDALGRRRDPRVKLVTAELLGLGLQLPLPRGVSARTVFST